MQREAGIGAAKGETDAGFSSGRKRQGTGVQHWVWELLEQSNKLPEMEGFRCQQHAVAETCGAAAGKSPAPVQHRHAGWLLGSGTAASHGKQVLNSRLCLQPGTWSLGFNY